MTTHLEMKVVTEYLLNSISAMFLMNKIKGRTKILEAVKKKKTFSTEVWWPLNYVTN